MYKLNEQMPEGHIVNLVPNFFVPEKIAGLHLHCLFDGTHHLI